MPKEKVFCRACHQIIKKKRDSLFQHHKGCAKEMLEAFYGWSDKSNIKFEEYIVIRSLLVFFMTWMTNFQSIIRKVPRTSLESNLNDVEKLFLKRDIANDYSILWSEISRTYPSLAEALNDLSEVLL
ncbi:MAG: hypothetical protein HeimC3_04180 [Candidatus Heimdallarchaeota archaeon LC_3]|nr:MAG: hypothetical protein HeimC3_04180 [Candidatus Heimdallarchaeota archaeon LC_3]